MAQLAIQPRWCRSRDACIAGVCAGLAKRFDLDAIVVRILAALLTIATFGLAGLVYIAFWIRVPLEPERPCPYDVTPEFAESSAYGSVSIANSINSCIQEKTPAKLPVVTRLAVAVCLMILFLVVSMTVAPIVSGTYWWQFWPLGLLIAGLFLVVIPVRTRFETAWHVVGILVTSIAAMILPMSLGVVAWESVPIAFSQSWPLVCLGVATMAFGWLRGFDALMVAGAFCITLFCLATLLIYSVPGAMDVLLVQMPDGRAMRISIAAVSGA